MREDAAPGRLLAIATKPKTRAPLVLHDALAVGPGGLPGERPHPRERAVTVLARDPRLGRPARRPRFRALLVVHGRSLGTGVAVQLAAARPLRCVVLTSPFDSLAAVGRTHYPWLPVGLLLRHRFDSAAHAGRIAAPALVVYGAEDTIIPGEHSERLAAAWGGTVERLRIEGHGHNDLDLDPRYAAAIAASLDRHH